MYKVAILGCENSHAAGFLNVIRNEKIDDIEICGVYSYDPAASQALHEKYGVPVMENYDTLVGQLDGLIITARHGDNHYKYAKPYLNDGIPMFIDKPITVSEEDAAAFKAQLEEKKIPACGGSMCVYADHVLKLREEIAKGEHGKVLSGSVRAPLHTASEHGGFFFYAQHLVQVMCSIFGYYPNAVQLFQNGSKITCITRYDDYDITGLYVDNDPDNVYTAGVVFEKTVIDQAYGLDHCSSREFHSFYELLKYGKQEHSYDEIFAPVPILNAMNRSLISGKEEKVNRI